jgi:hypothetical protein
MERSLDVTREVMVPERRDDQEHGINGGTGIRQ